MNTDTATFEPVDDSTLARRILRAGERFAIKGVAFEVVEINDNRKPGEFLARMLTDDQAHEDDQTALNRHERRAAAVGQDLDTVRSDTLAGLIEKHRR